MDSKFDSKCLHARGYTCDITTNFSCPKKCSFREEDKQAYLGRLMDIWNHYKKLAAGSNTGYYRYVYEYEEQILEFCEKYDMAVPGEITGLGKMDGLRKAYKEDVHRGSKGGSGDSDSNNKTSAKQKMNDNRARETKLTKAERERIKQETEAWEAEHGKLDKLSMSSMGRSKVDTYTGEPLK